MGSVLFRIAAWFLDGEPKPIEGSFETFRGIGIELFEQSLELCSRGVRSLALMDHGHADKDLGVVVSALLFPDIQGTETTLGRLECIDPIGGSFANGCDFGVGCFFDGFLLCFQL